MRPIHSWQIAANSSVGSSLQAVANPFLHSGRKCHAGFRIIYSTIELLYQCNSWFRYVCMKLCYSRDVKTIFAAHQQTVLVGLKSSWHMLTAVAPSVWVSDITYNFLCQTYSHPPLSIKPSLCGLIKKKKKAAVSLKQHSTSKTAEPVWKSLSHWVYFS